MKENRTRMRENGTRWRIILFVCAAIVLSGAANAQTINGSLLFSDIFSSSSGGSLGTPTYSLNGATWLDSAGTWYNSWPNDYGLTSYYHNNPISVDFGATKPGTPVEVDFQLYSIDQAEWAQMFDFGLRNSVTGQSYVEKASTASSYYGTSGFMQPYDTNGDLTAGTAGTSINVTGWAYMRFIFTPGAGVQVYQADATAWDLPDTSLTYQLVASWADYSNVQSMDTFVMLPDGSMAGWNVQDVNIYGTPQPPAATPIFSPDAPDSAATQSAYPITVTISCATSGATIYYTTDGSQPSNTHGTAITSGASAEVLVNTTLKAIAYATGYNPSATKSSLYMAVIFSDIFQPTVDFGPPTYSVNGATWVDSAGTWYNSWPNDYGLTSYYKNNPISVDFGATALGTPVEVDFQLYSIEQGAWGQLFDFGLRNSVTGQSYVEKASTASNYYGTSGFMQPYNSSGGLTAGTAGASINVTGWAYMRFIFTPGAGVQVYQADATAWDLPDTSLTYQLVASWADYSNVQSMDTFVMMPDGYTAGWNVQDVNIYGTPQPLAATPTFIPNGGNFTSARNVVMNCATPGATINYTTDGTTPTSSNGTTITPGSSVLVNHDLTLKAVAFATGYNPSLVAAASYYFDMFFMDNWSDKTVLGPTYAPAGVDWNVESGLFCADRTVAVSGFSFGDPFANALMFCPGAGSPPGSRIAVDFSPAEVGTPIEAHLKLAQTNNFAGTTYFIFGLADTAAGYSYEEDASPYSAFYGTAGFMVMNPTNYYDTTWSAGGYGCAGLRVDHHSRSVELPEAELRR